LFVVLLTLAAPMVAYAALRNAALDAAGGAVDPSAVLLPRSVLPQMKATMRAARQPQARLPQGTAEFARKAALKVPLAYEPYYIAARAEEQEGRYRRAILLMEEARRRRPNAASVRVALLGYYSLADAYQKAIDEADLAMRISQSSMTYILPAFAKLVALDPKARQAIAVSLARRPPWREAFLDAAVKANMSPQDARALVVDVRRLAPSAKPQAEETFLVRTLAAAGRYRDARTLWESYQPASAAANLVVDPTFRGIPGMPPFAWSLTSSENGTAEIGKSAGNAAPFLEVDYFGDVETVLAEQTLAARPGTHLLTSSFSGGASSPEVRLVWRLTCLGSKAQLARMPLEPLEERPRRQETTITVPASGCEGQSLALIGVPAEIARVLGAQIMNVSLTPASAGRGR
jgi:tetratricopeptide (TPR) repeat protein